MVCPPRSLPLFPALLLLLVLPAALLLGTAKVLANPAPPGSGFKGAAPNVLFIAVDDLRPEHGVYGGEALTPNIDAFARTATTFNRNYVQIGVCSPSRTSLLTGRYPDTTGVTDLWQFFRDVPGSNFTTLPQTFLNAGYKVIGSSKIFHPGHASGAGDDWSGAPCGPSCEGFNDPLSWNGYFEPPSNKVRPWSEADNASWIALDESAFPIDMHPDSQSAAFIAKTLASIPAGNTSQPFFLAAGFLKPHLPFIFPASFLAPYANYSSLAADRIPPANGTEALASWTGWSELKSYADISPIAAKMDLSVPGAQMPREKALELRRGYFAATSYNDWCVGQVLAALERSGHAETTTVVLWGDHGWQLGDHSDWTKHTNFESVVRAPLLIRAPAFAAQSAGKVVQAFTHHVDIFPTLVDLAGLPPQPGLQGESLVPLLQNPALPALPKRGPYAYSQYPRAEVACPPPAVMCGWPHAMGYTVRSSEFRYTEWVRFDNVTRTPQWNQPFHPRGKGHWRELYDHRGDTGANWTHYELANLIDDPQFQDVVASMSRLLHTGPNLLHPEL